MKRLCSSLLLCFSLLSSVSHAQNVAPTWTAIFQGLGDNSDKFNKIIPDGSGNFIGVGYTVKSGNYRDFLTIKFDANGDTLWWRTKNGKGNGDDEAVTVGTDASGNVFVAGYSDEDIKQDDIRIIKYDPSGTVLWDTLWDSPASLDDVPVELKIDGGGNCIIGGIAKPDTFSGSRDYITLKYDPNGVLSWSQQYSRPSVANGKDEISAIALDGNGDVYVTGRSQNTLGDDDFLTIKYDGASGTQLWNNPYNGGSDDRANDIVVDNGGNVIITGQSSNGSNYDFRTIKYNNLGSVQWIKVYNAPANQDDVPTAMTVDAADNVYVTGESDILSSALIDFNFQTIKYSSTGTQLWVVRTGNTVPQNDHPYDIVVDGSGNVYVTGKTDQNVSSTASDNDFMTVMYNASGGIQWGGPIYHAGNHTGGDDVAYSMLLDGSGNLYVAGSALNDTTQKDATVVKYDAATGNVIWVKDYNGTGDFNESVKTIVVDANNNSYAAGYTFNENNNLDACIAKVDAGGNVICTYKYQGIKGDDDEFNSIAISPSGIIYAAGYTKVTGQKSDFLLVKWDPASCDTVWTWTYDYIGQTDKIESMVLDAAGFIYITGRSDANPQDTTDNDDIVTMKLDNNGVPQWSQPQRFNGTGNLKDQPTKIILDNAGDVIVAGRTENVHDDDFVVLKYNSSTGNPVWGTPTIFGGPFANDDRVTDVAVDANNNIFVSGFSQTASGNSSQDPTVLKFDPSGGAFVASAFSTGDDKDEATKIAIDINNNVYVLYKVDNDSGVPNANNYDFVLRKYDNSLTEIWSNPAFYDSPVNGDDIPSDLTISPSGDIFITGTSENDTLGGHVNNNWVTLGYDPSGARIFISNFDINADDDSPKALTIRGSVLWVCGYTGGAGNNQKDLTINNYSLVGVGVNEVNSVSSAIVYPNPFSNECTVTLKNYESKSSAVIEIYDMLGNSVANPQVMNGDTFTIKRGNLAAGIYEYRIKSNSSILAYGKLVIN